MSTATLNTDPDSDSATAAAGSARRGRRRVPPVLLALSVAVAAVLLLPLVFLLLEAHDAGFSPVWHLIWRSLTRTLLWNTVQLTVVVTALCAVIGTLAAWFVECSDLPLRRMWAVLVVLPFAIPDFVVAFGWASISTWVTGFRGAVLVMTLAVYPLVYLPVAASLRGRDPAMEEAARSLGLGGVATFVRVTLRQARAAILGGCVLVALSILAEYGAFAILPYQTFTTEIYTEFGVAFQVPSACALSLVLVVLSVVVLSGEGLARGRGGSVRTGPLAQRMTRRHRLGLATVPVLAGFTGLVAVSLGLPVGVCFYWMFDGGPHALSGVSLVSAGEHTALYSAAAAALATLGALPVALLAVRHGGRAARLLERSTYVVLAMPGLVIALALTYLSVRAGSIGYQSAPMLVLAYAILFFPLALVGVRASVAHAPVALEETGRSLGASRLAVFARVTLPLVAPGLGASFCLVFLAAVTELTATLVLVPTGVQTLATQFWAYEQNFSFGQAAPFALVIIAVAAVPSYLVARYFDRLPARAGSR